MRQRSVQGRSRHLLDGLFAASMLRFKIVERLISRPCVKMVRPPILWSPTVQEFVNQLTGQAAFVLGDRQHGVARKECSGRRWLLLRDRYNIVPPACSDTLSAEHGSSILRSSTLGGQFRQLSCVCCRRGRCSPSDGRHTGVSAAAELTSTRTRASQSRPQSTAWRSAPS